MESMKPAIDALDAIIASVEKALEIKSNGTNEKKTPAQQNDSTQQKPKKEKKKKEKKPKQPQPPPIPLEMSQFLQCDLRVGKVVEVGNHPEGDILYVLKVSYGNDETKSVCAGLRKFIPESEMQDKMVVTICNLKPRKLRGVMSEAMILAGSTVSDEGAKEKVIVINPPENAKEGDIVHAEGVEGERTVTKGKNVSSKVWDKIVPRLLVKDGTAMYNGGSLVVNGLKVTCDLPDGSEIH